MYENIYIYMHIHIYVYICRPPDGSTKFPRKHPTNSTPLIDFGINYLEEPHLLPKRALLKTNRAPYFDNRAFYQLPCTLTSLFFPPLYVLSYSFGTPDSISCHIRLADSQLSLTSWLRFLVWSTRRIHRLSFFPSSFLFVVLLTGYMIVVTDNASLNQSAKSKNWIFLVQIQIGLNFLSDFVLRDTEKSNSYVWWICVYSWKNSPLYLFDIPGSITSAWRIHIFSMYLQMYV